MILPGILYSLNLINRTKFNKMAQELGFKCKERKKIIGFAKSFYFMVSFKCASTFCITNKIEDTKQIKKIFLSYDCQDWKSFVKLKEAYPKLMKKLKTTKKIPTSNEEVKDGFTKLYLKYETYIKKYINKKLLILTNAKFVDKEDIKSQFLESILLSYYKVFMFKNESYIENYFKMSISNAGKLMLEKASRIKRSSINNSLKKQERKIKECSITDELLSTLKIEEVENLSEFNKWLKTSNSIGSRLLRIVAGFPEQGYIEWLKKNKITKKESVTNAVELAKRYFDINQATWNSFKQEIQHNFL